MSNEYQGWDGNPSPQSDASQPLYPAPDPSGYAPPTSAPSYGTTPADVPPPQYPPFPGMPVYGPPPSQHLYPAQPVQPPGYSYAPPPPPPGYPRSQPLYAPPMVYASPGYAPPPSAHQGKPEPVAVAVEAICALFGIYGIGWLMSGRTGVGLGLLFGGLAWIAVVIVGGIFTGGLGCICLGPLHLLFIVASTITLATRGT